MKVYENKTQNNMPENRKGQKKIIINTIKFYKIKKEKKRKKDQNRGQYL